MECIPEEATTAFDNQTYQSLNYHPQTTSDSGFDSYEEVPNSKQKHPQKYENVDFDKTPEEPDETDFPSYENLEEEEQSYENIEPPLNYQNIEFAIPLPPPVLPPPTSLQSLPNLSHDAEAYENLQFQSLTDTSPKPIPVYAISTKKKTSAPIAMEEVEEAPVYENYDFQEEAIYQNMLVNRTGKLIPAKVKNQQGNSQLFYH